MKNPISTPEGSENEIDKEFNEFLHTKGIKTRFRLAFSNMADSARKQREADKAEFEARKAKSAEDNKEFVEFLHTKGFKAKVKLIIENIKKSAHENSQKAKEQRLAASARAHSHDLSPSYTAESLTLEFIEFLKNKGLDEKYSVVITEEE